MQAQRTAPWRVTFYPATRSEYTRRALDGAHIRDLATRSHAAPGEPTLHGHACFVALRDETGETDDCRDLHGGA